MIRTLTFLVAMTLALLGAPRPPVALAQTEPWVGLAQSRFQHYTTEHGLPQGIVGAISEDADGFIWVGTQAGLARWDGYRFRAYQADVAGSGALPDNFIQALLTDGRGRLWIGTSSGGLALYDRERDRFVAYPVSPGRVRNPNIRAIETDGADGVLIGNDGGLDHLVTAEGAVTHLSDAGSPGGLPRDARVLSIKRARDGITWIATDRGLFQRGAEGDALTLVPLPSPDHDPVICQVITEDSTGVIWLGTRRHGAFIAAPGEPGPQPLSARLPAAGDLNRARINTIAEVRPGEVWLGTYGQGIAVVDTTRRDVRVIRRDPKLPSALPSNAILAIRRDRAGLVWIGTEDGLARYDPGLGAVLSIPGNASRPDALSDPDVNAVLARPDGTVWAALAGNGVDIIDPIKGRVRGLTPDRDHPEDALPADRTTALAALPDGDVLIGTNRGLYRADGQGRRVKRVTIPGRQPTARVDSLLVADGHVWVGSFEAKLAVFDLRGGDDPAPGADLIDRISDQRIQAFERTADGAIWIGTNAGLNRLDPARHLVEVIMPDPKVPDSMRSASIACLHQDPSGRLWIGTGAGIDILTGRDAQGRPHFRHLGRADGLPHDNIDKILADDTGRLWVSTDGGLAVIDPETLAIQALRRPEGVAFITHWANAGAKGVGGEIFFGAAGGLTVVRPDRLRPWTYQPPIVVTDIFVGGQPFPAGRFNAPSGPAPQPLIVPPGVKSLTVEFAALDYSAPERNRYAYRLLGFDTDWIETDATRRLAAYTNLPPGRYRLDLRGANRDGAWSERSLTVPIEVLPTWYQTTPFLVGASGLGLALVIGLIQGRTAYLRRRQAELEALVAERTAALRDSQRQLELLAYYDPLTGLANRRMFDEDFAKILARARRHGARFALALLDLDHFKRVNDEWGHDAGDAVLVAVAARLRGCVREADIIARLGGDEFAILFDESAGPIAVEIIGPRILAAFDEPILFQGRAVEAPPSVGMAVFPEDGETHDALYKAADLALYKAKRAGRRTWRRHEATPGPDPA